MAIDLKVPSVGESVSEVEISQWLVKEGDFVKQDENIAVLESDKATLELPAPESGTITKITKGVGEVASVGEVIGAMEPGKAAAAKKSESKPAAKESAPAPTPEEGGSKTVMPAAAAAAAEHGIKAEDIQGSGPGGRVLKEDVLKQIASKNPEPEHGAESSYDTTLFVKTPAPDEVGAGNRSEEVVRMTPLRRTIARRLVEAQQSMAMLTTFNEVDMSAVMGLRKQFQESFIKRHDVKLGFMSFFVKAVVESLKECPALNAEIRDESIVYRNYYDIGVAIGGGKGLVVPVIRNAECLGFSEIEKTIGEYAGRAKANKLKPDELTGGTFTITNGGVYGSMLSTPIINPPQSGVLGMHSIQERAVVVNGEVVVRPVMYLALSYDHRIVDGREAVTFLKRIKEVIEDPARMLIEA